MDLPRSRVQQPTVGTVRSLGSAAAMAPILAALARLLRDNDASVWKRAAWAVRRLMAQDIS